MAALTLAAALTFTAGLACAEDPSASLTPDASIEAVDLLSAAAALPTSTAAGRTPGSLEVTASGAASYRIPIWTPPGVGDVELQLALQYNSRGANGVMGQGWSISALSAISRCNRTLAQDGQPGPVTLGSADRYCLDGQQLKLVSGTYGQVGAVYATEIESFSRIAQVATGAFTSGFVVTTRNGLVYEYGLTDDSVVAAQSGGIRTWALSRVRDRLSPTPNSISLTYQNDAHNDYYGGSANNIGTYRIASIRYPNTASGQGPFYEVTFSYSPRPTNDTAIGYLAGSVIREPNKLDAITIRPYGSATPTKVYNLAYSAGPATGRLRLSSVTECSASACLRPTIVTYLAGNTSWLTRQLSGVSASSKVAPIPVDLNADGRTDIVYPKSSGSGNSRWWAVLASAAGFSSPIDTGITTANTSKVLTGQFSGRGRTQLLVAQAGYWSVATFNGATFSLAGTGVPVNGEYSVVDWDGDGLPDLVSLVYTEVRVRRNVTVPPGAVAFAGTQFVAWSGAIGVMPVDGGSLTTAPDFNGDGRGDVLATFTDYSFSPWVVVLVSNGFGQAAEPASLPETINYAMPGDVNADGCTDLVSFTTVYLSTCSSVFSQAIPLALTGTFGARMVLDQDGDGRADVLYVKSSEDTWYVMRSLGDRFAAPVSLGMNAPNGTAWFVFDQNGDGLVDLGFRDDSDGGKIKYRLHDAAASPADGAVSFTDGFGLTQSVTYVPITRSNHTKYTDAVFPEVDVQVPLHVVSQVDRHVGSNGAYTEQFQYYGARVHLQGRGFEGFGARRSYDSRTGFYTFDYLRQAFPYTGMPVQRTVLQGNLTSRVFESISTPAVQTLGSTTYQQRFFPYIAAETASGYEVGGTSNGVLVTQTSRSYSYGDGYGNPTLMTQTITDRDPGSPFAGTSWQSSVSASYYNDTAAHCLGLPQTIAETRTAPGKVPMTLTRAYLADTSLCRMTQQTVEPGVPESKVTTTLGYDACGNLNALQVTGANWDGAALPARTTRFDYGSRCQLPETFTNPLGESSLVAYRYEFGVPASMTDANGARTTWQYDDFGRRTFETRPDQTSTAWSFESCNTAYCMVGALQRFRVHEVSAGDRGDIYDVRDRYYDGVETLVSRQYTRMLGIPTSESFTWDKFGRMTSRTLPRAGTSNNGSVAWTYDALGRLLSEKLYNSSGSLDRTVSLNYAGRSIGVTDPLGRTRTYLRDVSGRLRQVTDPSPGGATSYDYDSFGNLARVQDPNGAVSSGVANARGFRTAWIDADSGSWSYKRNSFGELVAWTDAKGQSFSATYDALGRLTSGKEPEGTSQWTWGSSPALHNVGRLQRVTGYGYSEDRAYDVVGRLATRLITTDQAYQYDYSYNSIGALDTLVYPASPVPTGQAGARFKVRYGYSYGSPVAVTDATEATERTLWALTAANDLSAPTSESLGGGLVTITSGYKPWTNELTSRQAGKAPATSDRQNLDFQYDTTGNLTQRRDLGQSLVETFTHDALNRLVSSTLNGVANLSVNYDAAGNISSKSDVGTYAYADPAHPHAVTSAGTRTFTYDANGNQKTRDGASQTWASFNLPTVVAQPVAGTTYQAQFSYGPDHARWKQVATYANGVETTQYLGGLLEKESTTSTGKTYWRHYVHTPSGFVVVSRNSDSTGATSYALTDHLGSTETVLDASGNLQARESYTAFGARRGSDWTIATPPAWSGIANTSRHGYTGHEHLDNVGLVHMGGRVFDPVTGRFTSADPLIGDLSDSQSINPYAYVGNGPMNATDPSGYVYDGGASAYFARTIATTLYSFFNSIAGDLIFGGSPDLPPATALPGISVQNGVGLCAPGASSPACAGQILSAADTPHRPGVPTSTWVNDAQAEADARDLENLERLLVDLGVNAIDVLILAPYYDAREAHDAIRDHRYGAAVVYVGFTLCDIGCKQASLALKPLAKAASAVRASNRTASAVRAANEVVPAEIARVVAGNRKLSTLGRPGTDDVFVVAADDIAGLSSAQIAERLTIPPSDTFTVIRFPTPATGIASPVFRDNPGFVQGGFTRGGAREYVIPNGPIPSDAKVTVVGP